MALIYESEVTYTIESDRDDVADTQITVSVDDSHGDGDRLMVLTQGGQSIEFPPEFVHALVKFAFGSSEYDAS